MTLTFEVLAEADRKEALCRQVLADLPLWFGLPESTEEYSTGVRNLRFWAFCADGLPVGFAALSHNSPDTAELYVLGVYRAYHRQGIGTRFLDFLCPLLRSEGYRLLEVKTLDSSRASEEYDRTRGFYQKAGFLALETNREIWGPGNPCLIMAKIL